MREPMIDPARYPLFDKLLFAVFVLAVPAVAGGSWTIFRDGDVSWHVAVGRWILAHGRVPDTDPFSHTMEGQPWVAFEWLSEVIYASAFNVASYAGLAATVTLALIAMYAILFDFLRRAAHHGEARCPQALARRSRRATAANQQRSDRSWHRRQQLRGWGLWLVSFCASRWPRARASRR